MNALQMFRKATTKTILTIIVFNLIISNQAYTWYSVKDDDLPKMLEKFNLTSWDDKLKIYSYDNVNKFLKSWSDNKDLPGSQDTYKDTHLYLTERSGAFSSFFNFDHASNFFKSFAVLDPEFGEQLQKDKDYKEFELRCALYLKRFYGCSTDFWRAIEYMQNNPTAREPVEGADDLRKDTFYIAQYCENLLKSMIKIIDVYSGVGTQLKEKLVDSGCVTQKEKIENALKYLSNARKFAELASIFQQILVYQSSQYHTLTDVAAEVAASTGLPLLGLAGGGALLFLAGPAAPAIYLAGASGLFGVGVVGGYAGQRRLEAVSKFHFMSLQQELNHLMTFATNCSLKHANEAFEVIRQTKKWIKSAEGFVAAKGQLSSSINTLKSNFSEIYMREFESKANIYMTLNLEALDCDVIDNKTKEMKALNDSINARIKRAQIDKDNERRAEHERIAAAKVAKDKADKEAIENTINKAVKAEADRITREIAEQRAKDENDAFIHEYTKGIVNKAVETVEQQAQQEREFQLQDQADRATEQAAQAISEAAELRQHNAELQQEVDSTKARINELSGRLDGLCNLLALPYQQSLPLLKTLRQTNLGVEVVTSSPAVSLMGAHPTQPPIISSMGLSPLPEKPAPVSMPSKIDEQIAEEADKVDPDFEAILV